MSDTSESTFKAAWEKADADGVSGQRVRYGLQAVANRISEKASQEFPHAPAMWVVGLEYALQALRDDNNGGRP